MAKNDSEVARLLRRNVSGSSRAATRSAIKPPALMQKKFARQPKPVCSRPPIIGPTIGAMALIDPMSESSRAACTPE